LSIPDPGSQNSNKREGRKKFVVIPFFVVTKTTKLKIKLILNRRRKNFGPVYKELKELILKELSTKKIVIKLSKYGFGIRDPRSQIRKKPIPDPSPGVKKAPDPGSATLVVSSRYLMIWKCMMVGSTPEL
jgi:hypothetical protein